MGIIYVPFALIFQKILCEFRPLPTFIFATLCLLLLEQLSHLLWHPNLFLHFLLSVCVCVFVCCVRVPVCLCVLPAVSCGSFNCFCAFSPGCSTAMTHRLHCLLSFVLAFAARFCCCY